MTRRLLTVGHSYAVALNRRLAHSLQEEANGRWEVTVAAPSFLHADLKSMDLERMENEPTPLKPVPAHLTQSVHLFFYGRALRKLLQSGFDVVHLWEEPYVVAGAQIAAWTPESSKLVFTTCQNLTKRYPLPFRVMEEYVVRRCSGWTGIGETVRETLTRRTDYAAKPHLVLPLGVDEKLFQPSPSQGIPIRERLGWAEAGPPIIGFLGRFTEAKGLDVLVAALRALRNPWRALFVGVGEREPALRDFSRVYPQARVVTGVRHHEVPAYLNAMDILAAPSQTTARWREQFGRMIAEAQACGVPVVGSRSGEVPHTVGDAGVLVDESDIPGWTQALDTLLRDGDLRKELSAKSRRRAEAVFAWPVVSRKFLDFLERIVEQ